jgi:DNA mismatch repair protein MLH1
MFPVVNPSQLLGAPPGTQKYRTSKDQTTGGARSTASETSSRIHEIPESDCLLTSVEALRSAVGKAKHKREPDFPDLQQLLLNPISIELAEILEKHIFVGIIDLERSVSLMQHSTNLYLVNHASLA